MTLSGGRTGNLHNRCVAILTGASLSKNPRAFKEAKTIASAGFNVVVYGACFGASQRETDKELARRNGFSFKSVLSEEEGGLKRRASVVLATRSYARRSRLESLSAY